MIQEQDLQHLLSLHDSLQETDTAVSYCFEHAKQGNQMEEEREDLLVRINGLLDSVNQEKAEELSEKLEEANSTLEDFLRGHRVVNEQKEEEEKENQPSSSLSLSIQTLADDGLSLPSFLDSLEFYTLSHQQDMKFQEVFAIEDEVEAELDFDLCLRRQKEIVLGYLELRSDFMQENTQTQQAVIQDVLKLLEEVESTEEKMELQQAGRAEKAQDRARNHGGHRQPDRAASRQA